MKSLNWRFCLHSDFSDKGDIMNFLQLINKCLLELNYKQINTFSELVKYDHKRIINIINVINKEICHLENWNFLLRKTTLNLPAKTSEIPNKIDGRILYLLIDGKKYKFVEDFEPFLTGQVYSNSYSVCADKLLLPKFDKDKTIDIVYYTNKCVQSKTGDETDDFTSETDASLIPMPFAEELLVYGTCLRFKANPQHIKFSYWMSMYKEALLNLKSKSCLSAVSGPRVRLFRNAE